jgi:hypothetical protein
MPHCKLIQTHEILETRIAEFLTFHGPIYVVVVDGIRYVCDTLQQALAYLVTS